MDTPARSRRSYRDLDTVQARLRFLRESVHSLSLREFQERVNAQLPKDRRVSLGTVANYERTPEPGGRGSEPRADYLAAVSSAFPGLRVEWLLLGAGEPTHAAERVGDVAGERTESAGALGSRLARALPDLALLSPEASALFVGALTRYATACPDLAASEKTVVELAADLRWLLLVPLEQWGFRHDPEYDTFGAYSVAMLHALSLLLAPPGHGDPYREYASSLVRRLRERFPVGLARGPQG